MRTTRLDGDGRSFAFDEAGRNLVHAANHNQRIVLEAIRRAGPMVRADLARLLGLTEQGVGNILRHLVLAGLVAETARAGRAASFDLIAAGAFGLGIHLDGAQASAMLLDLAGTVHLRRDFAAGNADALRSLAQDVAVRLGDRRERLAGCCTVSDGGTDFRHGASLAAAFAFAPLVDVGETAAAVLGELCFARPKEPSFALLTIGRTIRAGFVIDGRLFESPRGRVGRVGGMRIDAAGTILDAMAGTGTIPGYPFDIDAHPDAAFAAWLDRAAGPLLDAVVAMAGFLAPDRVLVGGPLPRRHLDAVAERLARDAARRTDNPVQPNWLPRIASAGLGREGVLMGAAAMPFFDRLLPDPRRGG